jgi:transcriptional regulator with XRE-family HTH domain
MNALMPRPQQPRLAAPYLHFGNYVRERRRAKQLTLRACAQAIGLNPGHLSNIENGRATAPTSDETLLKWAEMLDVPVGTLLARAGRLGPDDLRRFWTSPLIPALIMSSAGWDETSAKLFQETVLASLDPMGNPA